MKRQRDEAAFAFMRVALVIIGGSVILYTLLPVWTVGIWLLLIAAIDAAAAEEESKK